MKEYLYPTSVIAVVALVTWALRAAPFILFGNRPLPKVMKYLSHVLPPAIMTVLVIYCLRNTQFIKYPFGIPELAASAVVIGLHLWRKNMYLSIVSGTFCYMFLLRML